MTFSRYVTHEPEPTDAVYRDTRGGFGAEIEYNRSPKSGGQFRVERIRVEQGGKTFEFLRRNCCATEADHAEDALAAVDLTGLPGLDARALAALGWRLLP